MVFIATNNVAFSSGVCDDENDEQNYQPAKEDVRHIIYRVEDKNTFTCPG